MRRSAPRGARHARTLPDRGGRRSTRAADAAEDRGEAGAPSRGISGEGHAQRQQDRPHHRVRQGARAGVSGTQERVEIKAPSGRVAAEFTPYSAEAARALEADLRASLGMAVNFGAQSRALFATRSEGHTPELQSLWR